MTARDILVAVKDIPDDWIIAPWGERQGIMDGSWCIILVAHFQRQYSYKPYTRIDHRQELLFDQVIVYAQTPHVQHSEDGGSWGRSS